MGTTYWEAMPLTPPETSFENADSFLGLLWPSALAQILLVPSKNPNFMEDSGMTFTTLMPFPKLLEEDTGVTD